MFELQIKKYESDLHSYEHYLSISEKKAWEKKNSGLYGIWTHDLCDTCAVFYQLSKQANNWLLFLLKLLQGPWLGNISWPLDINGIYLNFDFSEDLIHLKFCLAI